MSEEFVNLTSSYGFAAMMSGFVDHFEEVIVSTSVGGNVVVFGVHFDRLINSREEVVAKLHSIGLRLVTADEMSTLNSFTLKPYLLCLDLVEDSSFYPFFRDVHDRQNMIACLRISA